MIYRFIRIFMVWTLVLAWVPAFAQDDDVEEMKETSAVNNKNNGDSPEKAARASAGAPWAALDAACWSSSKASPLNKSAPPP